MADDLAIKVENLSKVFKLPHDKATSLKSSLINIVSKRHGYELQRALDGISFEVKKGEFYGIVGRNGGGKSTLLKIISGIYTPSEGTVHVHGKLTPFIELGVGFNPELTGRENVFLNGALLGFNRKEMAAMYDDIVKFAELERFMDQKLKNYSSGMQVRLAFSIAIRAKSDILVMDEVLAVGDAAFQKKCFNIFRRLKKEGRTIVLVTHDMANVERFCDRVLVIHKGKQVAITTPSEASALYARLNVEELKNQDDASVNTIARTGLGGVRLKKASLHNGNAMTTIFNMGDDLRLRLEIERDDRHKNKAVTCGLAFFNEDGVNVMGPNSEQVSFKPTAHTIEFTLRKLNLTPGEYAITIGLYSKGSPDFYDLLDKWISFSVIADHVTHGIVEVEGEWKAE